MRIPSAASDHRPGSVAPAAQSSSVVELSASDLPAYCPNAKMPLWSSHPKIFLDVVNGTEAMCPYCGTRYRLGAGVNVDEFDTRGLHQHQRQRLLGPNSEYSDPVSDTVDHRAGINLWADALGNTTLELIPRWLRGRGRG